MCELSEARLAHFRQRLEENWHRLRADLVARLAAAQLIESGRTPAESDVEQLVQLARRVLPAQFEPQLAQLIHVDAALCQMELGLYGLCSDCEEPLELAALENDPATQRCPRCETRYRKGNHTREL
ncbi:transcriptional regulator, TraR/DksA family [Aeromonas sp. RU39B]|nr:transcriptional regulator, TraR/DksA family [Aeromonas sp. RU39B]